LSSGFHFFLVLDPSESESDELELDDEEESEDDPEADFFFLIFFGCLFYELEEES